MKKNRLILFLFFSFIFHFAMAKEILILTLVNGQSIEYELSKKPELTFSDKSLTITFYDKVMSVGNNASEDSLPVENLYDLTEVKDFHFVNSEIVGIENVMENNDFRITRMDSEGIGIASNGAKINVGIYDISGKLRNADIVSDATTTTINIAHLEAGTYIVKINNKTIKYRK